jgi:hypothetical protein
VLDVLDAATVTQKLSQRCFAELQFMRPIKPTGGVIGGDWLARMNESSGRV